MNQKQLPKCVAQQYKNGNLHNDAPEAICSLSIQLRPLLYVKMQLNKGIRKLTIFVLRAGIVHTVYIVLFNCGFQLI